MSTAHDLPTQASPEAAADGPHLALVPPLPGAPASEFDLESALAEATPRLQRYATRRLGSAHEAEEVVQEALLRAYQHRSSFATMDDLMAWSTVVTGRLVIDRVRVRGRSVAVAEVPELGRIGRDTADVVVARDEARLALDALECMPARQAAVLWAREVEGQSYDEIAERYGLSEPSVRSLLHRARKTLRREYAARGGTLPVGGLILLAPWLKGLSGLGKLRDAVRRAAVSGAALSVGGLAAITAIGLSPTPSAPAPAITPAESRPIVEQPALRAAVDVQVSQQRPTTPARAVARRPGDRLLGDGLRANCAGGLVRAGCAQPSHPSLFVGVQLPDNPTGIREVGVSSDRVDCQHLPATPATKCEDQP